MGQPVRALLAPPAHPSQGTRRAGIGEQSQQYRQKETTMIANAPDIDSMTLNIKEDTHVRAPIAATFAALLEEMGPSNEGLPGSPMPFTLEAWPGGRWFRDLGNGNGHLWGHVQAIK